MATQQTSGFRTMEAQSLTRQARQVWESIQPDMPSPYKGELKNIVDELIGRVDFVFNGQAPRAKTTYQSLEASALTHQARHVVSQISRNIPVDKRDNLGIIEALADRVEFAAIGSPSVARAKTTAGSSSRSRP
jgi:hypothetical protein